MKAKLAFTAISEIQLHGRRAAAMSCAKDAFTKALEAVHEFSHDRRRFLGVAALSLAAMQLGPIGPAKAQGGPAKPARPAAIKPGTNTSFAALKQIDAGPLNVGYAKAGPADGPPVLLLHGWPYDMPRALRNKSTLYVSECEWRKWR
jgi:hypothetical protein